MNRTCSWSLCDQPIVSPTCDCGLMFCREHLGKDKHECLQQTNTLMDALSEDVESVVSCSDNTFVPSRHPSEDIDNVIPPPYVAGDMEDNSPTGGQLPHPLITSTIMSETPLPSQRNQPRWDQEATSSSGIADEQVMDEATPLRSMRPLRVSTPGPPYMDDDQDVFDQDIRGESNSLVSDLDDGFGAIVTALDGEAENADTYGDSIQADFELADDACTASDQEAIVSFASACPMPLQRAIYCIDPSINARDFAAYFETAEEVQKWTSDAHVIDHTVQAVSLWQALRRETELSRDRDVRVAVSGMPDDELSRQLDGPETMIPLRSRNTMIPFSMAGTAGPDPNVQSLSTLRSPTSRNDCSRIQRLKDVLYAVYESAGCKGSAWVDAKSEQDRVARKDMILIPMKDMEQAEVSAKVSAWNAWVQWCQGQCPEIDMHEPGVLDISRYLQWRGRTAPTAAMGAYRGLAWLQGHIGIKFHTDTDTIAALNRRNNEVSGARPVKQAEVPTPSFYTKCIHLIRESTTSTKRMSSTSCNIIVMLLVICIGCVRLKHAQISWVKQVTARFIVFYCPKGKRKIRGLRIPFEWAIPRKIAPDVDVWEYLAPVYDSLAKITGEQVKYVMPNVAANAWGEIRAGTEWVPGPMSYEKFRSVLIGVACYLGVDPQWAKTWTTYSPRRWMPTLASHMGFSLEQKQSIGNWQDVPEHSAKEDHEKAKFPMCQHYSGQKTVLSGHCKGIIVTALHMRFTLGEGDVKITPGHAEGEFESLRSLQSQKMSEAIEAEWFKDTWKSGEDSVAPALAIEPVVRSVNILTKTSADHATASALPIKATSADHTAASALPIKDTEDSMEEASASSDQASSLQEEGGEWFMQGCKGPIHVVIARSGNQPIPWCRYKAGPFGRSPVAQGYMSDRHVAIGSAGMHVACIAAMPPADREKWLNWFNSDDA